MLELVKMNSKDSVYTNTETKNVGIRSLNSAKLVSVLQGNITLNFGGYLFY